MYSIGWSDRGDDDFGVGVHCGVVSEVGEGEGEREGRRREGGVEEGTGRKRMLLKLLLPWAVNVTTDPTTSYSTLCTVL